MLSAGEFHRPIRTIEGFFMITNSGHQDAWCIKSSFDFIPFQCIQSATSFAALASAWVVTLGWIHQLSQ